MLGLTHRCGLDLSINDSRPWNAVQINIEAASPFLPSDINIKPPSGGFFCPSSLPPRYNREHGTAFHYQGDAQMRFCIASCVIVGSILGMTAPRD